VAFGESDKFYSSRFFPRANGSGAHNFLSNSSPTTEEGALALKEVKKDGIFGYFEGKKDASKLPDKTSPTDSTDGTSGASTDEPDSQLTAAVCAPGIKMKEVPSSGPIDCGTIFVRYTSWCKRVETVGTKTCLTLLKNTVDAVTNSQRGEGVYQELCKYFPLQFDELFNNWKDVKDAHPSPEEVCKEQWARTLEGAAKAFEKHGGATRNWISGLFGMLLLAFYW